MTAVFKVWSLNPGLDLLLDVDFDLGGLDRGVWVNLGVVQLRKLGGWQLGARVVLSCSEGE